MKYIIVTGGAGFIGTNLIRSLLNENDLTDKSELVIEKIPNFFHIKFLLD